MEELFKVIWKSMAVFFSLIILARIIGKKLLSQMSYFDFVIAIVMGTVAGTFITTEVHGVWVLLSPVFLTALTVGAGYLSIKSLAARKIMEGEPVIVVHNGKVMDKNMAKLRYSLDDLEMQLREKNVFDISEVEFAVFEPHGQFSVLKKPQYQPATAGDLGKNPPYKGMATEIIKDGDILEQNLQQNNLDLAWLMTELNKQGIHNASEVFYASLQSNGVLYVDLIKDNLPNLQKVED